MIITIKKQFPTLQRAFRLHSHTIYRTNQSYLRNYSQLNTLTMSKIITVFGATGNQGGSVITHLLNDSQVSQEYKIRGITRDTSKPAAQELAKKGVEVVSVRAQTSPSSISSSKILITRTPGQSRLKG